MIERQPRKKIVIIDSQPVVVAGLESIIRKRFDFDVGKSFTNGRIFLLDHSAKKCDAIILGIENIPPNDLSLLKDIKEILPTVPVLVYGHEADAELFANVISCGALGYVISEDNPDVIARALGVVSQGCFAITPKIAPDFNRKLPREGERELFARIEKLTTREKEVVRCLAMGLKSSEIAVKMGVKINTVNKHRENIRDKIKPHTMREILMIFQEFEESDLDL